MDERELASYFDHTLLKAYATRHDFERLTREADTIGAAMVAINSGPVKLCAELLCDSSVHVGAAIAFPLGQMSISSKLMETENAIVDGADEIDYVINIGEAKMHHWRYLEDEMQQICTLCRKHGIISKVIFENCYLDKDEIRKLSEIAYHIKPDFIKTSTGFGSGGATIEDVKLMKEVVNGQVKVKAAGGIRDWATCQAMIAAGAQRIGTSSSLVILEQFKKECISQ